MIAKRIFSHLLGAVLLTVLSACQADSADTKASVSGTSHLPGKMIDGIHYFPACLPVGTFCMEISTGTEKTVKVFLGNEPVDVFSRTNKIPSNYGLSPETLMPKGVYMVGL